MTDDQQKQSQRKGKQRREIEREPPPPRKNVSVRLTPGEHRFFSDASNLLGQTLSVIFRNGAIKYVEDNTPLRKSDYPDDPDDSEK